MRYDTIALAAASAAYTSAKIIEVSDTLPLSPVPYVVRHLDGPKVLLADDVFRFLSNENTTGTGQANETADGFSMLLCNGKPNAAVPPHYVCTDPSKRDEPRYGKAPNTFKHTRWHETFIPMTGLMTVWADGVPKDLGEGDFAMVPAYHNHTYQFIAQETEFLGLVQPAGFDDFFANVSAPWAPKYNVPFPPDQPLAFPGQKFQAAVKEYDINQISANWTDPVGGHGWHAGNVSLPNDSKTPYFLPNGAGPHYWNEGAGAVISPLATPVQTDGNFTIAHITLRKSQNSLNTTWTSADHQFLYGMRGEVTIFMEDEEVKFISGDSVFIPAGQEVKISSRVNYSKFLLCAAGSNGVDTQMIKAGKVWEYSTPPAH